MNLAEYNRRVHPSPVRMTRVAPPKVFELEVPTITIPVKKITLIKASVLAGIVASYLVPPQYAVAVAFVPNAYWMFKL